MRMRTKRKSKKLKQPKKIDIEFQVVIRQHGKKPLPDFGQGPGVLCDSLVTYTDIRGNGFKDNPMFQMEMLEDADKILKDIVTIQARMKPHPWHDLFKRDETPKIDNSGHKLAAKVERQHKKVASSKLKFGKQDEVCGHTGLKKSVCDCEHCMDEFEQPKKKRT